ncbi:MAG: S4 domain-containing protein [Tepidisphaeraceae bacterium]
MPDPADQTDPLEDPDVDVSLDGDTEAEAPSDDASLRHFCWRIGRNLERRVDQYLVDRVGYLSRNEVQRLIDDGFVTVNGKKTKPSYRPKENDQVAITAPPPRAATIAPEDIPLDVVYEDDHLLAINKQTNIIVHPARCVERHARQRPHPLRQRARQQVEHDQRRMAARHSASTRPEHHRHHAGREIRRSALAPRTAV